MAYNSHGFKRYLILNMISHLGPISRTELIELTDYRPASVTEIIKELLDEKLIVESGQASVGHGRKRTMLEINKGHLCAVGLSFTNEFVNIVLSRVDGVADPFGGIQRGTGIGYCWSDPIAVGKPHR